MNCVQLRQAGVATSCSRPADANEAEVVYSEELQDGADAVMASACIRGSVSERGQRFGSWTTERLRLSF